MDPLSFRLTLPALPGSISVVRHVMGAVRGVWPVSEELLDDIQIAVSEACTNVVRHAYDATAPGILDVRAAVSDDEIVVRVRDNGTGVRPHGATGLGFGLALIAALTLRVEIGHEPDGAHQVAMVFAPVAGP